MWHLRLGCNGCGEDCAWTEILPRDKWAWARDNLRHEAERLGWERVRSPDDGERWFCPRCRRARAGNTLETPHATI